MASLSPDGNRARNRNRTLALAGGALAALSLAYGAYTWYASGTGSSAFRPGAGPAPPPDAKGKGRADRDRGLGSSSAQQNAAAKLAARPTLSLSLPPSFRRTPQALQRLAALLEELSLHYVVHLILPEDEGGASSSSGLPGLPATASRGPPALDDDGDGSGGRGGGFPGAPSAASITAALCMVRHFDVRRILEYGAPQGRQAVARALACDAHVQVISPSSSSGGNDASELIGNLEQLQKSCGLIVIVALHAADPPAAQEDPAVKQIVSTFSERPAFRVYDLTARSPDGAWGELAARLAELRAGWK